MASLFEYEKEAIRIKAKRVDRGQEEQRKFSVDPNITSFEVLQSILCRAFELPPTDISISYRSPGPGGDVWLPMLSDWDLDTAILGSADHDLHLQVAVMGQGSLGEVESIVSPVAEAVAKELEPVQRGLTQAGAQVCSVTIELLLGVSSYHIRSLRLVLVFRDLCRSRRGKHRVSSNGMQPQHCQVSPQSLGLL